MFYIIDLGQDPPVKIENLEFELFADACSWIDENGSIIQHTISEE